MNRASRPASSERCCTQSGTASSSASTPPASRASRRCHCSAPLTIPASRDSESHREVEIPPYSSCSALRELRVGQEVHHRLAREVGVEQRQQPERLAPERPLGQRRALMQVHRDPGLDEHRLGERQVRLAVPVGDRHVPERHALPRPLQGMPAPPRGPRATGRAPTPAASVPSGAIAGFAGGVNSDRRTRSSADPPRAESPTSRSAAPPAISRRRSSASGASAAAGTSGR